MKKLKVLFSFWCCICATTSLMGQVATDVNALHGRIIDAPPGVVDFNYNTQANWPDSIYFTATIGSKNTFGSAIRGGVYGEVDGPFADTCLSLGVYGLAFGAGSGAQVGLAGAADGLGQGEQYGVLGFSRGFSGSTNYGCYGLAAGRNGNQFGLYGVAHQGYGTGGDLYGVFGEIPRLANPNIQAGVAGIIYSIDGDNFRVGVSGATIGNGPEHWAGYFVGDLGFTGQLTNVSDGQLKKNVAKMDNALDKIMALEPVNYEFKTVEFSEINLAQGLQYGFIAQDVEKILPALVVEKKYAGIGSKKDEAMASQPDPNSTDTPISDASKIQKSSGFTSTQNLKSVNYIGLIPLLTKGVQEQERLIQKQQNTIEVQENTIAEMEDKIDDLTVKMAAMEEMLATIQAKINLPPSNVPAVVPSDNTLPSSKAILEQNAPNPFNQQTTIRYFIPKEVKQAQLQITDLNGQLLQQIAITQNGWGNATIQSEQLPMGTYLYSLIIDGKVEKMKKMIITR